MKPAPFRYFAPTSLSDALNLMAEHGYDAKPLAGGQSLVPTMNFRLSQPAILVDLNNIPELAYIRQEGGSLRIGAMTRQRAVERDPLVAQHAPLLHETMPNIAHHQIRNRGTVGGSLAHADPAAELPAVALALDARVVVRSREGQRVVPARDFYVGLFAADLGPDELLTEVIIPPMPAGSGWAFAEVARRPGDYALVGAAALVTADADGRCREARLTFLSVGEGPVPARQAMQRLVGQVATPDLIAEAAEVAATLDIDPPSDIHASAAYRRHLARVLARRTLSTAFARSRV